MVYARQGQYEKAREELETSARFGLDEPKVHYQLSQVYARLGWAAEAARELERYREAQKKADERLKLSQSLPFSASAPDCQGP